MCVCEITELLDMSQPAVSQHLSELSQAELIDSERKGQWTFYFSTKNQVNEALEDLLRNKNEKLLDDIKAIKNQNLCELRDSEGEL